MRAVTAAAALCLAGCRGGAVADAPEKAVAEGWRWYGLGEFGLAVKAFETALAGAGTNRVWRQQALYGLGNTWNLRRPGEDPVKADACYREGIAAAPESGLAAWIALALARMRAAPVGGEPVDAAVQEGAYQEVIDAYPGSAAGEEAFLHQQAAHLEEPRAGRADEVLRRLEAFLAAHPGTPWRGAVLGLAAHCCLVLDQPRRRVDFLLRQLEENRAAAAAGTPPDNLLLYWWLATAAQYDLGDFPLARDFYGRLIRDYPVDQRVFLAKKALRAMDEQEREWLAAGGEGGG